MVQLLPRRINIKSAGTAQAISQTSLARIRRAKQIDGRIRIGVGRQ